MVSQTETNWNSFSRTIAYSNDKMSDEEELTSMALYESVDLSKPRYDQNTYLGRLRHFISVTNPLNVFASTSTLEQAKCLVTKFKRGEPLPANVSEEDLWKAKSLYDSAFHPDTGEKNILVGRMSAQVPCNLFITGMMMTFYKTTPAVIFWQWLNQSFNALVNYTNRSGDAHISTDQMMKSYALATGGAVGTALGLNRLARNAPPVAGRLVPFVAVAAANCINIPCMRASELKNGTPIFDQNGNRMGTSRNAAESGIKQVIFSRILMASPGMVAIPFVMNHFERVGTFCRYPWAQLPLQLSMLGVVLVIFTPIGCALFKQRAEIKYNDLEPELQQKFKDKLGKDTPYVFFYNKGL